MHWLLPYCVYPYVHLSMCISCATLKVSSMPMSSCIFADQGNYCLRFWSDIHVPHKTQEGVLTAFSAIKFHTYSLLNILLTSLFFFLFLMTTKHFFSYVNFIEPTCANCMVGSYTSPSVFHHCSGVAILHLSPICLWSDKTLWGWIAWCSNTAQH